MARSTAARMRLRRASAVVIALGVAGLLVLVTAFVLRGSLSAGGGPAGPPPVAASPSRTPTIAASPANAAGAVSVPPLAGASASSVQASPSPAAASSTDPATTESAAPPPTQPDPSTVAAPVAPTVELPVLDPSFERVLGTHGSANVVYLTFDDGPGPQTPQILDVLAANGVKATFCQVGSRVNAYAATERRIAAEGHTLCNHSWSHPENLDTQSAEAINAEISQTQQVLASYGVTSRYFRAPGGNFATGGSTTLRQVCQLDGVYPLGWQVDSQDWRSPGVQQIVDNVVKAVSPGAIVLLHDAGGANRDQTIAALPTIIGSLRAAGYDLQPLPPNGPD